MNPVTITHKGDFNKLEKFLKKSKRVSIEAILHTYGEKGVALLSDATPKDTGKTSQSWGYKIVPTDKGVSLQWYNTNVANGYENIALLLQYGHATGSGAYIEGIDYINPALRPIFKELGDKAWKEVIGR